LQAWNKINNEKIRQELLKGPSPVPKAKVIRPYIPKWKMQKLFDKNIVKTRQLWNKNIKNVVKTQQSWNKNIKNTVKTQQLWNKNIKNVVKKIANI